MYRIRYYKEVIHPDHFKGSGWLGFLIIALNFVRWKLETLVQSLTLRWLAKRGGLPKSRVSEVLRAFELDCAQERLEKEQTSPRHVHAPPPDAPPRADRYAPGRFSTALGDAVAASRDQRPTRPQPLSDLLGKYGGGQVRAQRYIRGRAFQPGAPQGEFEPLTEEES